MSRVLLAASIGLLVTLGVMLAGFAGLCIVAIGLALGFVAALQWSEWDDERASTDA